MTQMDRISKQHRSWNMSRIRGRNTKPELVVRSLLHRMGYRFRLHRRDLPGRPDVVLPRHRTAVLIHGCFWHRHAGCKFAYTPKSRPQFWGRKFEGNQHRDQVVRQELARLGWNVVVVWECEVRDLVRLAKRLSGLIPTSSMRQAVEAAGGSRRHAIAAE